MELNENICFRMIASIGEATSCYMEAIEAARNKEYERAMDLLTQGAESALECHHAHAGLLTAMANHEKMECSLLLIHAEDQMMNGEMMKLLANELIEVYKKVN